MGQLGFFDADKRLEALSARGHPLEAIDHLVPWESFRAEIEAVVDRLAEPGLQHSPPGDAGTARRGMKTVESSAVSNEAVGGKKKPGRQSTTGPNPNLCPRTLFEVPFSRSSYAGTERAVEARFPHLKK